MKVAEEMEDWLVLMGNQKDLPAGGADAFALALARLRYLMYPTRLGGMLSQELQSRIRRCEELKEKGDLSPYGSGRHDTLLEIQCLIGKEDK